DDLVGIEFETRDHLAAAAAGAAPAGLVGLEHHGANAALGEMQGRREPGKSAADDADVGRDRLLERRRRRWRSRGGGAERRRERKGFGHGDGNVPCLWPESNDAGRAPALWA